jgi:Ras-related protein Rab-18
VTKEQGADFARKRGMVFIETSAKTKVGIQQAFEEIVQKVLDNPNLLPQPSNNPSLNVDSQTNQEAGWCQC